MRFGILGPLEVVGEDGVRRDPAATRQRRLLLSLLVRRDEPVSVDRLVDELWPDGGLPRDPVGALRTYVTRLRGALEPEHVGGEPQLLIGGADHYRLNLDGHEVDAEGFEADLARGAAAMDDDPGGALSLFERALGRWRGPALLEVADEHWAMPSAVHLEELRLTATEHRLDCLVRAGRHHEAAGELERHVRMASLRERPHGLLMIALDRCGRTAEAAEAFRLFRERLVEETGLEPSADLQQLHERLLAHSSATTFADTGLTGTWNDLPATPTGFIGRERDRDTVRDMLAAHNAVTLTGVGGVGKTRLAVEVARAALGAGGSVLFVDLAPITDREGVPEAVFSALRLPAVPRTGGLDGLVRLLASRPAMMVLDNCEHVLDEVANLVDRVARECPALTVLATSREPVGADGERVYRLPSLDVQAGVALFLDRATAAGSAEVLEAAEHGHIEDICQRLDGIPLAIELAATRTAHLSVADIARRLDERFWLLAAGRRALPRHQTLQAAIDWSYDLLDAEERAVLGSAAVFVDGFDIPALAAVTGRDERETLDIVASLVGKSLIETDQRAGRVRYRLLETVRLYALDRLGEAGETASRRQAHADHHLASALLAGPVIDDLPAAVERSMCRIRVEPVVAEDQPDLANNLAALDWFDRGGDRRAVGRLAARVATVLGYRSFLDPDRRHLGRDDVVEVLTDPADRAMYLTASALNACYFGDFSECLRFGRLGVATAADPATRGAAAALTALASTGLEPAHVADLVDVALRDLPRTAHYSRLLLRGQRSLSLIVLGQLTEAVARLEAHALDGDVFAASEQMLVLHVLGEDDGALAVSVPHAAHAGSAALWSYRWMLTRALAAAARGEHTDATRHLLDAADRVAPSPVPRLDTDILVGCAALAHRAGEHRRAAHLLAAVQVKRVRSPAGFVLYRHYRDLVERRLEPEEQHAVGEHAGEFDPRVVLHDELARRRAELTMKPPAGRAVAR